MALKKIIVSVTNDLTCDQRVDRVCRTLSGMGFGVLLAGRRLPGSLPPGHRPYATLRMHLFFRKGPLFYAEYNLRLFFLLLNRQPDLLLANDLDTLAANRLAGQFLRIPVIYDSHEYFTEVPELTHRPRVKKTWEWLEKRVVPGVAAAYTVCQSIADIYTVKYGIPFRVVRNLPAPEIPANGSASPLPGSVKPPFIIYQGALNVGRGLEQAIRAMAFLPEVTLLIAGRGDREEELRQQAASSPSARIVFAGRLSPEELQPLTRHAALGFSLEEELGLNYRYALPNKLFDYIRARIPVIVSDLPEMAHSVHRYDIGMIAPSSEPQILADLFRKALFDPELRKKWHQNLEIAARELTWSKEEPVIREIFLPFLEDQ